jgi:hypothetical protein
VKNDGVRSCLDRRRVTMALAEGVSAHYDG